MNSISTNGTSYPIKTGYSAVRLFCIKRGIEFYQFNERFAALDFEKLTVENIDDFAYMVLAFVDRGCELDGMENKLSVNDVS